MNAARKLITFVRDHAGRICEILHQEQPSTGDLNGTLQMIVTLRGDLDECEQRIRAEVIRRTARPTGLIPHRDAIASREFATDAQRARVQSACGPTGPQAASPASLRRKEARDGGRADGAEDVVLDSIACDHAVESPQREQLERRARLQPGRYSFDFRRCRLVLEHGTASVRTQH